MRWLTARNRALPGVVVAVVAGNAAASAQGTKDLASGAHRRQHELPPDGMEATSKGAGTPTLWN